MEFFKVALTILASFVLVACTSGRYKTQYSQLSSDATPLDEAKAICKISADSDRKMAYMALNQTGKKENLGGFWGGFAQGVSKGLQANDVRRLSFKKCMAERGWVGSRVRVEKKSVQTSTSATKQMRASRRNADQSSEKLWGEWRVVEPCGVFSSKGTLRLMGGSQQPVPATQAAYVAEIYSSAYFGGSLTLKGKGVLLEKPEGISINLNGQSLPTNTEDLVIEGTVTSNRSSLSFVGNSCTAVLTKVS